MKCFESSPKFQTESIDVEDDLVMAIAALGTTTIEGAHFRYTRPQANPIISNRAGGRWNPPLSFPAMYFANSSDTAVAEAYRRIVDAVDGPLPPSSVILRLWTVEVNCTELLDLRSRGARISVGISDAQLYTKVNDYAPCQRVGSIAHQLGLHGLLAPSSTRVGEVLVLFERNLPVNEMPKPVDSEVLTGLPPDPRRIRDVTDRGAAADD